MSLLTEIKLNDNCGKLKTKCKGIEGVGVIVPDPEHQRLTSLLKYVKVEVCDWMQRTI